MSLTILIISTIGIAVITYLTYLTYDMRGLYDFSHCQDDEDNK